MKRVVSALTLVLVACGGGNIEESATTVVDSTTSSILSTTTTTKVYDLEELLCGATPSPPHAECSGDASYASISLPPTAIQFGLTDRIINVLIGTLGFPASLRAKIENTRALDGTLTDESLNGYSASWTYHPDDGLSLVVEKS
jgi:hypothetical protein